MKNCVQCVAFAQTPNSLSPHSLLVLTDIATESEIAIDLYVCAVCQSVWVHHDHVEVSWSELKNDNVLARLDARQHQSALRVTYR